MPKADVPTVLVRGLPATLSDADLAAHFAALAPVRRAFAVRGRGPAGARPSKGNAVSLIHI